MTAYKHGVYVTEQATAIIPPRRVEASLPVVFGTAPCHCVDGWVKAEVLNKPILAYTYQEAVAALGFKSGAYPAPIVGTADGGNTGDGTCTGVKGGDDVKIGDYTLECIAEATDAGTYKVTDPDGTVLDNAEVGTAYTDDQIEFTLNDGTTDFAVGDKFTITIERAWDKYTLCEFMKSHYGLFNRGPVVFINVFDPSTHKTSVSTAESQTFDSNDEIEVDYGRFGLVAAPVVKDSGETTTYTEGIDYSVDYPTGVITRIATGAISAAATVKVTYDYANPGAVDNDDIVGGITGDVPTGLELVNSVFPMFRMVPGIIASPGWSHSSTVSAVMHAKAGNINTLFKAICVADIDDATADTYSDVPAEKTTQNMTDEQMMVCWPKLRLGTDQYHFSTQLAGLIAEVDGENDDIPYKSPSNNGLQMDAAYANDAEVWLGLEQANYLNGQGVITALNFEGGWKCWGNRTGAYPTVTDVKDAFLPIRRMFNWIGNTLILTFWQKLDFPITRRLIETIVDSGNIWLNSLAAREYILGGRVEFLEDENAVTDTMDGILKFHVYVTPPSPAREIDFILEYDPEYLSTLFGE